MRNILIACAVLLLASCQDAPAGYKAAQIAFPGQPIRLNAFEVRIIENYKSPMTVPNVDQEFPNPPVQAIRQWAAQRIQTTTGAQGVFEITIDDASVKEVKLPKTQGIKGLFTDDQDARYDASIKVTMRLYNGVDPMSVASGDVFIKRSKSINEKATVNDRMKMFDGMTKDMMAAFDTEAQSRLRQYFASYIR